MGGEHGDPISYVHEGRLYRLCCKSCIKLLTKSPAEYAAKVDAAVVKEQLPSYPLETCPVGGEKLGSAGEPVDLVVGTRLVRLCCAKCKPAVAKDSAAVLAKVNAALIEKQSASYKLETCPISGEKLGGMGEPMNYLYGTRLVKLCCKGCVKGVTRRPGRRPGQARRGGNQVGGVHPGGRQLRILPRYHRSRRDLRHNASPLFVSQAR